MTRAHLIAWRDELRRRGLGGATIRHRLASLASLFEYLCEKNAVTHNPVKGVERPKTESGEGKTPAIGDHQARDLLAADTSHGFDAGGDHDGAAREGSAKGVVESADDFSAGPQNPTLPGLTSAGLRKLAVHAVPANASARANSLLTGKITGTSSKSGRFCRKSNRKGSNYQMVERSIPGLPQDWGSGGVRHRCG